MTLSIIRQRKLRTGSVNFSSTTATDNDEYLVVVNERCSKEQLATLFISYTPPGGSPNPVPKLTLKAFQSGYLICDSINVNIASERSSKVWRVTVNWKELQSSEPPQRQDQPMPGVTGGGTPTASDPDNWDHTWSRRLHIAFEEFDQIKLYYKGGYSGSAHAVLSATPEERKLFCASNFKTFRNPPPVRRPRYVWNFRWIKSELPASLKDAEGKLNSEDFTIRKAGRDWLLKAHTALIDSVELSSYTYNGAQLTEISVEIVHNPFGWYIEQLDQGDSAKGSSTANNVEASVVSYKPITDTSGRVPYAPQNLDGDGDLTDDVKTAVYGTWSDYEEVDFASVALIEDLAPPAPAPPVPGP